MPPLLQAYLLGILAAMISALAAWQSISHFDLDILGYAKLIVIFVPTPMALWFFYTHIRRDDQVAGMLFGLVWLAIFGPCCQILSYFLLSILGPRIDESLAAFDKTIGFDWSASVTYIASHPIMNSVLETVYRLSVWQILLAVVLLGWRGTSSAEIGELLLAIAICGLGTIFIWALFPAIGATAVHSLSGSVEMHLQAAVDNSYTENLINLYVHGPGRISPADTRGLVGFPSFHTQEAIVATWYLRKQNLVIIPVLIFNILTIVSCPVQGGHHLADIIGGVALAAAAIAFAAHAVDRMRQAPERNSIVLASP